MKNIAFTICAKNYIGLAQVLHTSIQENCPGTEFFIIVADEFDFDIELPSNVLIGKDFLNINADLWYEMAFKYDLTEFCTCIKPYCFEALFSKFNPETCIFFDPDIFVFNGLESIYNQLETNSIVLTPHITTIQTIYTGTLEEKKYLFSGVFNLGFIAVKNDAITNDFVNWWKIRLMNQCFKSQNENYFTDQKWIDFLPSLIPSGLCISFDLGNNVAPWNFYERRIIESNNEIYVTNRIKDSNEKHILNFVHFSGFKYGQLISGNISQGNIADFNTPEDFLGVFNTYQEYLVKSNFLKFAHLSYSYNSFSNGTPITDEMRRIYRSILEEGLIFENPFSIGNKLYLLFLKSKLVIPSDSNSNANINSTATLQQNLSKLKYVHLIFKLAFKLLGSKRYFNLLKLLRRYSILENQIFLVADIYNEKMNFRK